MDPFGGQQMIMAPAPESDPYNNKIITQWFVEPSQSLPTVDNSVHNPVENPYENTTENVIESPIKSSADILDNDRTEVNILKLKTNE